MLIWIHPPTTALTHLPIPSSYTCYQSPPPINQQYLPYVLPTPISLTSRLGAQYSSRFATAGSLAVSHLIEGGEYGVPYDNPHPLTYTRNAKQERGSTGECKKMLYRNVAMQNAKEKLRRAGTWERKVPQEPAPISGFEY